MPLWSAVALGAMLVAAAVTDLRSGKIPNYLTYPAILLGLVGHGLGGWLTDPPVGLGVSEAVLGLVVGLVPLLLCLRSGGIGGGDAKLMGAVGALTGWRFVLAAMVYGFLVAGVMGVVVMIRRRIVRRTLRRVLHALALLLTPGAQPADPTDEQTPRIPLAVALCLGTAAAMIEQAILRFPGSVFLGG